jgi:hypothetical protein
MLSEITDSIKKFNTIADDALGYEEGEILGFAYFAEGKIYLVNTSFEQPYIRIGNQYYDSNPKTKANYRAGLTTLIKKGYAEKWEGGVFILTRKGWNRARSIVEDIRKNHCKNQ